MKRAMFALFAALALVFAMPAVAQEETQDPELEAYETRTNPNADSHAPGSGLTITGTVEEVNDEQLTLRTATGIQHIQLVPKTQKPVDLQVGQNVSVDYTRTGQGIMIAQKVRTGGEVTDEATTTTATTNLTAETEPMEAEADLTAETDTESDFDANAGLQADVETENAWETETDVTTDLDTDVETTTADTGYDDDLGADTYEQESDLPATGSELPLLALLGLLSLAAAFGVRSFVR